MKKFSFSEAIYYFEEMKKAGFKPEKNLYSILLHGLAKSQNNLVEKYFKEMAEQGYTHDDSNLNSLIESYSRIPEYEKCKQIYLQMIKEKREIKIIVFKCMMKACNSPKELKNLYMEMKCRKLYPDEQIFFSIHIKCIKKRDRETSLWLEKEMQKFGLTYPPGKIK